MSNTTVASNQVTSLEGLSDDARIWIFQSSRPLVGEARMQVSTTLITFLKDWAAHGKQLFAAFEIHHDQFIVIAVDEAVAQATGCSMDKLMRTIQQLDEELSLNCLDRMKVAYRDEKGAIAEVSVNAFTKMLEQGDASKDTYVFNNVLETLGEWRKKWEMPVASSWHANLLP
jgi:hypothetical protein